MVIAVSLYLILEVCYNICTNSDLNPASNGLKRKDAERIISAEQLISYNLLEDSDDASEEMVIKEVSGKWAVYATFIRRLRALNKARRMNLKI